MNIRNQNVTFGEVRRGDNGAANRVVTEELAELTNNFGGCTINDYFTRIKGTPLNEFRAFCALKRAGVDPIDIKPEIQAVKMSDYEFKKRAIAGAVAFDKLS